MKKHQFDSENKSVQPKARKGASLAPPAQRKENKTGMPDNLKSGVENLSGMDMSDVKVHYNSSQPAQLNAHAYAQGNRIHLAPGQEKHLPHEAWHVVQQKQGRVKATRQMKGKVNVNDDAGLEKEADAMGRSALYQQTNASHPYQKKGIDTDTSVIQRVSRLAEITWSTTHLVKKMNNSLLGAGDFLEGEVLGGELHHGERIIIDEAKTFLSRRGSNQEVAENRAHDKRSRPSFLWYHVKYLNGNDVADQKLYVRQETLRLLQSSFPEAISHGSTRSQKPIPTGQEPIPAHAAQELIMGAFKNSQAAKQGAATFRAATFKFTPEAGLTRKSDPIHESHGMQVNLTDMQLDGALINLISGLTRSTMQAAGQWDYLLTNWDNIKRTHVVAIDVDVYLDRMGNVGFHKDSRGRTLFVNLTYSNDKSIQGPEWIRDDMRQETGLTSRFPDVVKADIDREKAQHLGENVIHTTRLPAHGRVSFSDPVFYHSTPLGRRRKLPASIDFNNSTKLIEAVESYYGEKLPDGYKGDLGYLIDHGSGEASKILFEQNAAWPKNIDFANKKQLVQELNKYFGVHLTDGFIGAIAIILANGKGAVKDMFEQATGWPEKYNSVNTQQESLLGPQVAKGISNRIRETRVRRLSTDLQASQEFASQLAEESANPRAFIRTWVRLVPNADIEHAKREAWS